MNRIVVLIDNNSGTTGLASEHGFSVLIENEQDSIVFDFGKSNSYWNNALMMGFNLGMPNIGVLSHGHYDHGGGLVQFLERNPFSKIYAHPSIFKDRYSLSTGTKRYIGLDKVIEEKYKDRFIFSDKLIEISKDTWFFGEVGDNLKWNNLILEDDSLDPIEDDSAIVIKGKKGLLVITGCCHSGLMALLNRVHSYFPDEKIIGVMGGLHLNKAPNDYYYLALQALVKYDVQFVGAGHCTGLDGLKFLHENSEKTNIFSLYSGFIINYI